MDSQSRSGSDGASMVLDSDVDMHSAVGSDLGVIHGEDIAGEQEGELLDLGAGQCQLAVEDLDNASTDEFYSVISSDVDSILVVDQCGNTSEDSGCRAVSLNDPQLNDCSDKMCEAEAVPHEHLSTAADVEHYDSTTEKCVQGMPLANVESYTCDDRAVDIPGDSSNCTAEIQGQESLNENEVSTVSSLPTGQFVEVTEQHKSASEMSAQAVPLTGPEPDTGSDKAPESDSIQQESFQVSEGVLGAENESYVIELAGVESESNTSDIMSVCEESDSDCIILDVSRSEASDCIPVENEVELLHDDHTYSVAATGILHSPIPVSSTGGRTSQADVIQFSVASSQARDFDVGTVLPFPSLITHTDVDELYPGEHLPNNASLLGAADIELIDSGDSRASGLDDERRYLAMDSSSYPVVEIVPHCDEMSGEVGQLEHSVSLSSQESHSTADITCLSTIADADCDKMASGNVVAASNTNRAKASKVKVSSCV